MKRILVNAFWLMVERISLSLSGVFVSIYVARYLGPAQFGTLNYLLATIAIVVPLVELGADSVVFNRISRRHGSGIVLLLASIRLQRWIFLLAALPVLVWSGLTQSPDQQVMTLLLLASAYFSVQDIYKIYYDARLCSKRNTIINNLALILSIILRLALVYAQMPLVWFAVPYIVSSALPYCARRWLFKREQPVEKPMSRRNARRYSRYLLKVGLPLALASLSIVIYTRIDQIMLGNLIGEQAVGWYSAATMLSQGWVFVPMALITSLMPSIANCAPGAEQDYRIRMLFSIVLALSLPVLLVMALFAEPLIALLYGPAFHNASAILGLCTLTSLFSVMGTVSYRSIVLFSGYLFIAIKMPVVAVANVLMNLVLIPRYGLEGAAISTMLAEFLSFFIFNSFFRRGKITRLQVTCLHCLPRLIRTLRRQYAVYTD